MGRNRSNEIRFVNKTNFFASGKEVVVHQHGYSSFIGILVVGVDTFTSFQSYLRYTRIKNN